MTSKEVEDLDYLRSLDVPKVLSVDECARVKACDSIWRVVNTSDQQTTFRVHPFPEVLQGSGQRRSIREHECAYVPATFPQFQEWLNVSSAELLSKENPFHEYCPSDHFWAYCDYKEAGEVVDCSTNKEIFSWDIIASSDNEEMGTFSDSKIWIGSKGAHTALHYDTYGVNLVFQVKGCKVWKLWKPSSCEETEVKDSMRPTRVPYEESSVFSRWDIRDTETELRPPDFEVRLAPGQALFVPKAWWHDVECDSDMCISLNMWLDATSPGKKISHKRQRSDADQSHTDSFSRVSEAIARVVVSSMLGDRASESTVSEGNVVSENTVSVSESVGVADWVNPTETIYDAQDNLDMLSAAVGQWSEGELSDSVNQLASSELLHNLLDSLLHPAALQTATHRLLSSLETKPRK